MGISLKRVFLLGLIYVGLSFVFSQLIRGFLNDQDMSGAPITIGTMAAIPFILATARPLNFVDVLVPVLTIPIVTLAFIKNFHAGFAVGFAYGSSILHELAVTRYKGATRRLTQSFYRFFWRKTYPSVEAAYVGNIDYFKNPEKFQSRSIEADNVYRRNALHWSAERGHREIVHALLKMSPHLLNTQDKEKRTPLHLALYARQNEIRDLLLQAGASTIIDDQSGTTSEEVMKWRKESDKEHLKP